MRMENFHRVRIRVAGRSRERSKRLANSMIVKCASYPATFRPQGDGAARARPRVHARPRMTALRQSTRGIFSAIAHRRDARIRAPRCAAHAARAANFSRVRAPSAVKTASAWPLSRGTYRGQPGSWDTGVMVLVTSTYSRVEIRLHCRAESLSTGRQNRAIAETNMPCEGTCLRTTK